MNKTIKGGSMMLFVGDKSIACATSHELNVSMETVSTANKDTGGDWDTNEAGLLSWTAKSENVASVGEAGLTQDDLLDLMIAKEPVELIFGPKKETGNAVPEAGWTPAVSGVRKGKALITNVTQNAPNGENTTFTVDFTGTGPLEKVSAQAG